MKFFIILERSLWIFLLVVLAAGVNAVEESFGNPSMTVSAESTTSIEQWLEAALQLREAKPELFAGALGVLIVSVVPGSQAAEKGLRAGDIVIAYAGEAMNSVEQLIEAVQAKASESQVTLRFIRGKKVEEVALRGGKMGVDVTDIGNHSGLDHFMDEGRQAYESSDIKLAIAKWQIGLEKARKLGDKHYIMRFAGNIAGISYLNLGQYQRALDYYQQALKASQEIRDKDWEESYLNSIGLMYYNLAQYEQSSDYFKQHLAMRKKIIEGKPQLVNYMIDLAKMYYHVQQYQLASEYHQEALAMYRDIDDEKDKGDILNKICLLHIELDQPQQALDFCQQALVAHRIVGNRIDEAWDLSRISELYGYLGQYKQSLDYSKQALVIHRALGDRNWEGMDLVIIGLAYQYIGQYQQAEQYFQQSLEIYNTVDNKRAKAHALGGMGLVRFSQSKLQLALEHFQQALVIYREIDDKRLEGITLSNIGSVYFNLEQYHETLDYFKQALTVQRSVYNEGTKGDEGVTLGNIGIMYGELGQHDNAKSYLQESLKILEAIKAEKLWVVQQGLATAEAHLNESIQAIEHYEQSLKTIEALRAWLPEEQPHGKIKSAFMEDKLVAYDSFIAFLQTEHPKHLDKGYDRKAFETFERKQARVFLEQMGKSTAWHFTGVPKEITEKDRDLENQVAAVRKNLSNAYAKGKNVDPEPFRKHLETLEKEQHDFEEQLKTAYPNYYALKYPKPVKLDKLRKHVLQADEIVLIYNVREEATDLWFIGKQHFQMFSLPLTEAQIKEYVAEFRQWGIDNADTSGKSNDLTDSLRRDFADFTKASHALYQQLFPQAVRDLLDQAKPKLLYLVPTADLYELPFEALITTNAKKPHYLLEDYAISYLSSASLLKTLRDAKKDSQTQQDKRQPLLAFADPVYPPCSETTIENAETTESVAELQTKGYLKAVSANCFPPLPSSGQEAHAIAELLEVDENSQPSPLQLKEAAAKSTVFQLNDKQQLDDYQYILFSAHAILPDDNEVSFIRQPAIVLSHTQPTDENGFLTMGDVFGLAMNTDLVMLSACNTGLGKEIKGEGIIGLTRAFMYAGTPAVSITLWSVESNATKELNVKWFNHLKNKQTLAESLRAAKLDMLANKNYYRYPYAWAGIVVFGEGK